MRQIKLYIACSIDGYIAYPDGGIEWLYNYPIDKENDYGYSTFFDSIDTVLMGGRSFRDISNMDFVYPYQSKHTYVITQNESYQTSINDVQFISKDVIQAIRELKDIPGKDIWLVGGGKTLALLLENNLVDMMIVTHIPILLGDGIPLFPKMKQESNWQLTNIKTFNNNTYQTGYQHVKQD